MRSLKIHLNIKLLSMMGFALFFYQSSNAQVGSGWGDNRDYLNIDNDNTRTGGPLTLGMLKTVNSKVWSGIQQTSPSSAKYNGLLIDSDNSSTHTYNIWMQGKELLMDFNGQRFQNDGAGITWGNSSWNNSYSKIYDDGQLHIQTDDNFYIDDINSSTGASTNAFYINTNLGKVGIGTIDPTQHLEVKPDTDNSGVIGKAHIGYVGYNDWAGFSHYDQASDGNYALLQSSVGHTLLNSSLGQKIGFRIDNVERMYINEYGTGTYEGVLKFNGNMIVGNMSYSNSVTVPQGYSTAQQESHYAAKGHLNTPWTYTHAIEAPNERGSASTMILIGDAGDFTTTGLSETFSSAADQLHFITNGKDQMSINSSGYASFAANMGIGTAPVADYMLSVNGESNFTNSVGIGSEPIDGYMLAVGGKIRAHELELSYDNWPDYVFGKDYQLRDLSDVKTFIAENGHLPDVKSAEEVEKNGLGIAETNKMMMQKIEELTLYIIDLQDQLNEIKTDK